MHIDYPNNIYPDERVINKNLTKYCGKILTFTYSFTRRVVN